MSNPPSIDPQALIAGVREGLALASRPGEAPGWQAVGLVLALQGALALALTAYDTADPLDVLDPAGRDAVPKLAPVPLLLRRAGSADHLADPERLVLSRAERRDLAALVDLRNRRLHPIARLPQLGEDEFAPMLVSAVRVLRHLLVDAPAFDPGPYGLDLVAIRDALAALS